MECPTYWADYFHNACPRAGLMEIMPALGQALWLPPNLKSEFQGYNVKMPRHSRDQGKNARPRAPPAAFGLPRPSVYGSPQAAGGALGAGIMAMIPRPAM